MRDEIRCACGLVAVCVCALGFCGVLDSSQLSQGGRRSRRVRPTAPALCSALGEMHVSSTAELIAGAELSRDPPLALLSCARDDLVRRATEDRLSFLAYLKTEFGLPLGDRQRIANCIARLARDGVKVSSPPTSMPSLDKPRKYATAAEAIAAGDVAFVTLTNSGYLEYTRNCLTSLEIVNEPVPLTVYCADTHSHAALSASHAHTVPMHEQGLDRFLAWKEPGWARLMWLKCEIMRRALASHAFVVFTDGDITYERRGAVEYCVEQLLQSAVEEGRQGGLCGEDNLLELVMQSDGMVDGGADGWGYCAGFMAARSTVATRACFAVDESHTLQRGWDDQRYLNNVIHRMRHKALPLRLFPNGQCWRSQRDKLDAARGSDRPYLVHFNWIVGGQKQKTMADAGKWYVR